MEPVSTRGRSARCTRGLLSCGLAAGRPSSRRSEGATRSGTGLCAIRSARWRRAARLPTALTGTLVLAGAAGERAGDPALSTRAGGLIGAAGAGLIGAAVFVTIRSAATRQEHPTRSLSPAAPACCITSQRPVSSLPAAAFTSSWRSARTGHRRFGLYCAATATIMLATTVLAGAASVKHPGWSSSPDWSSEPASRPASAGSRPCPRERSHEPSPVSWRPSAI